MTIGELAKELHEAGREAVVKGATVAAEKFGDKSRNFIEWENFLQKLKKEEEFKLDIFLKSIL